MKPLIPTAADTITARSVQRAWQAAALPPTSVVFLCSANAAQAPCLLPEVALRGLEAILGLLADGRAFAVLPLDEQMTTQQVADWLGMSRPHVARLADRGVIPSHKTGTHRRFSRADVAAYRAIQGAVVARPTPGSIA